MEDLQKYYKVVEEGLSLSGVNPELCRSETEGQWNLTAEDVDIWVDVLPMQEEGHTYFQVMSPLVAIPTKNTEVFLRELLDLSYMMVGVHFASYKDGCYIKITKEADHVDPEEVAALLHRVAYYGKMFGKRLQEKYNTSKIEHHE